MTYQSRPGLKNADEYYHPGFSVDCVVFGFHDYQLKVLLVKREKSDSEWGLPGGGMMKNETAEEAAVSVLQQRTGLKNIFLRQFHLFSTVGRGDNERKRRMLESEGITDIEGHWIMQRFITMGFYALVKFDEYLQLKPERPEDNAKWFELDNIPKMILDHRQILDRGLEALRLQLNHEPIGYNLLPEKFTMPELQKLYEAVLGVKLERSNFKRKMLSYNILINTFEQRMGGKHKAPFLYTFDKEKYQEALQKGLQREW